MNTLPVKTSPGEIMETVLIKGDLSKLTADERMSYYKAVCDSVGLNALTKPFEYITLNGKLQLYALKACTDQLRAIHDISVTDLTKETIEGVHIVTAKVQNGKGRTDADIGAVNIAGLKGEVFANAIMKASTKAKRRATLSICGLGMLDETEVEDIPRAQRVPSPSEVEATHTGGAITAAISSAAPEKPAEPARHQRPKLLPPQKNDTFDKWAARYITALDGAQSADELTKWDSLNDEPLGKVQAGAPETYAKIEAKFEEMRVKFQRASISSGTVPPAPKAERPEGCPNAELEPDAFVVWATKRMDALTSAEELTLIWENEITPASEGLFKPDCDSLQAHYEQRLAKLGG